jgi:hypothetical protein
MRINWDKIIFVVIMLGVWLMVIFSFLKIATDKKEARQEYLIDSFSPMSDDAEIQEAYDEIRPDFYIIGVDTLVIESP